MTRIVPLVLLLFFIPLTCVGQAVSQTPDAAPPFRLKDIRGKAMSLNDYKGKVVLLNFWATWCAPCRAEMPDLVKLQNDHKDRGLQVVGITYPRYRQDAVRRVSRELKINYPILLGTLGLAAKYGVGEILPATIVVDREGKVHARILGILEPEEFDQHVKPLLR